MKILSDWEYKQIVSRLDRLEDMLLERRCPEEKTPRYSNKHAEGTHLKASVTDVGEETLFVFDSAGNSDEFFS